jgi:hypothetical protein
MWASGRVIRRTGKQAENTGNGRKSTRPASTVAQRLKKKGDNMQKIAAKFEVDR